MLRLHGARAALAAASVVMLRQASTPHAAASLSLPSSCRTHAPLSLPSLQAVRRLFSTDAAMSGPRRVSHRSITSATSHVPAPAGFLRGVRLPANVAPLSTLQLAQQVRAFRVKNKEDPAAEEQRAKGEEEEKQQQQQQKEGEEKAKAESEGAEEEGSAKSTSGKKKPKGKASAPRKGFMDHIRGLREDYAAFPDIYNSANMINFVIFTVFCLCSTGSTTEEEWWMSQWGLDNSIRPWTWFLHSFLTNNFLSMTYAMMLLHTMCHHVLPILGSRGLMLYCGGTAVVSGAIMWLGNWLYYGSSKAPEKQFGPWDIIGALFVMEYFYYGLTPFTILNSFSGWIKYAVWVGEVCILYFDWQPTVVGTLVGLALCRGVPMFRGVKPPTGAK